MKPGAKVLGHIDCPYCGTAKGMRITPDKNGAPFGYCEEECGGQLRVGGSPSRVRAFLRRFPWAAGQPVPEPVTVTAPAKAPEPVTVTAPAKAPEPAPATRKRTALEQAFAALGGQG